MNPNTKYVKYVFPNNGSEYDKEKSRKLLQLGKIYAVKKIKQDAWYTEVWLEEFPETSFNSVQFESVESEKETKMLTPLKYDRPFIFHYRGQKRGITVVFDPKSGNFGHAVSGKKDQFCRKMGRTIAS